MKKLVMLGVVATVAVATWRIGFHHSTTTATAATDGKLAFDRLWIDHLPKNDRDPVRIFVALTEEPFGVFQTTTNWKGEYEVFTYEANGNEVRALFPQDRSRERFLVDGTECHENKMDYCLEIKGASRAAKRYYSMKGWELDGTSARSMHDRVDAIVHALPAAE
jgi:hypothetical protein